MEITISQLCTRVKLSTSSSSSSSSSSVFCLNGTSKRNLKGAVSVNSLKEIEQFSNISFIAKKKQRSHAPVVRTTRASVDENQSPTPGGGGERWLLQPVGDGDTRHIGYKVEMPAPLEIASGQVTVGRLPEKADVVIPVATVSGVHATINTEGDKLLVTDMNSTNGTFIEDKRLIPGVAAPAFPGTRITFGDTNLAIFRVFKLQDTQESTTNKPTTE